MAGGFGPVVADESNVSTSAEDHVVPSADTCRPEPPVLSELGAAATVMYQIVPVATWLAFGLLRRVISDQ